jgi:hypothetical protein
MPSRSDVSRRANSGAPTGGRRHKHDSRSATRACRYFSARSRGPNCARHHRHVLGRTPTRDQGAVAMRNLAFIALSVAVVIVLEIPSARSGKSEGGRIRAHTRTGAATARPSPGASSASPAITTAPPARKPLQPRPEPPMMVVPLSVSNPPSRRAQTCQWPIGDVRPFRFCGAPGGAGRVGFVLRRASPARVSAGARRGIGTGVAPCLRSGGPGG